MSTKVDGDWTWIKTGREMFPEMLSGIDAARHSVWMETYTFAADELGQRFRDAFVRAAKRGLQVRVLYDALGSMGTPAAFWTPVQGAGGEVRQFNPLALHRLGIRNHRKLLVCDKESGFIGGFNISSDYEGDGVSCGWCDLGLKIKGPLVEQLARTFEDMFQRADFLHKRFARLRRFDARKSVETRHGQVLLSGPGRELSPIKIWLKRDLARARHVDIMVAYFLPTWRLRHELMRVSHQGGRVRLLLAGKSDVPISQLAGQSLYRRLLRAGIQIFEYQPQILHAKLSIIDDAVYAGSANMDHRSLNINYELMVRFNDAAMATEARDIFEINLQQSKRITLESWRAGRSWWRKLKQHWAYFLLVRIDPYVAHSQWRALPD